MANKLVEEALSALGANKDDLTPGDLQRLDELRAYTGKGIRTNVEDALDSTERRELSPERADELIGILRSRFKASDDEKLRNAIDFTDVEKALRASPADLSAFDELEKSGGENAIVRVDGNEFVIEDRCKESPAGRRNLDFDEANAQRESFGPNVEFQSEDSYRAMQREDEYDFETGSWLKTGQEYRERTGGAMLGFRDDDDVYVYEDLADDRNGDWGWRAALRVKKA